MQLREFLSYFDRDLFFTDLKSTTKEDVLPEMVNLIAQKSKLKDSNLILDMLRRREQLGSTGIGKGLAIPHGRSLSVAKLLVTFGKSEKGIDYHSMDEQPVHLIFMIIAPPQEQSNVYLPFLGKLVELMKQDELREKLLTIETYRQFRETIAGGF